MIASFASLLGSFGKPLIVKGDVYYWIPNATYLVVQGALLAYLLGRNFRSINGFHGWRSWCFALLAPTPILLINLLAGAVVYTEASMADLFRK